MKKHIDEIIEFLTAQLDGEQPPPLGSKALARLSEAVGTIQQKATGTELQMLGLRALGVVIDRVRSGIGAAEALRAFIRGDGHV